jgi:hypothetical protein
LMRWLIPLMMNMPANRIRAINRTMSIVDSLSFVENS